MDTPAVPAVPATPAPVASLTDLIKVALDAAKMVEGAYPAGTPGADKLAAVMTLVNEFAPLASVAAQIIETVIPKVVSFAVQEWNAFGVFVHHVKDEVTAAVQPSTGA